MLGRTRGGGGGDTKLCPQPGSSLIICQALGVKLPMKFCYITS